MGDEYYTLLTIFNIVKNDPSPETYLCSAREIILRQLNEWNVVEHHLKLLAEKGFVIVKQLDKIAICITAAGIEKVKSFAHSGVPLASFSMNVSK
jgi:hypothetical protein